MKYFSWPPGLIAVFLCLNVSWSHAQIPNPESPASVPPPSTPEPAPKIEPPTLPPDPAAPAPPTESSAPVTPDEVPTQAVHADDMAPVDVTPLDEQKAVPYKAVRESDIDLKKLHFLGDAIFQFQTLQRPSSEQNHGAFSIPYLTLGAETTLASGALLRATMQLGENRDATSHRYDTQTEEMWISGEPIYGLTARLGLQPSPWNELWNSYSALASLAREGRETLERFDFLTDDMGLQIKTNDGLSRYMHLLFFYKNGEGRASEEKGSHKDIESMITVGSPEDEKDFRWTLAAAYHQGNYENIDPTQNVRNRTLGLVAIQWPRTFRLLGEYFETQDAIDGLPTTQPGPPDLSSRAGQIAKGKGWQAQAALGLSFISERHLFEIFVEGSSFDPDNQIEQNNRLTSTYGVNCYWSDDLTFTIATLVRTYQPQYGVENEDRESLILSTRATF